MLERFVRGIIEREGKSAIQEIPVDAVSTNPYQPRRHYDQEKLEQLAQSIKEHGVLQPIIVRGLGNGYELVCGERRLRACRLLQRRTIPAIVRRLTDQDVIEITFIENLQREQLNESEEAEAYHRLVPESDTGAPEDAVRRVGKDVESFQERIWMLHLPHIVRKAIVSHLITSEHARLIALISNEKKQIEMLERIYREKLSVDDTRQLIDGLPPVFKVRESKERPVISVAPSLYSRHTVRQLDGSLLAVRELVSALRACGVHIGISESFDQDAFRIQLSFPVK